MQASNTVYATKNCILLKINLHTSYAFGGYRHFTQVSLNMALLIVQHFTKDVPRPKVLPSTTLAHLLILWLHLGLCVCYWAIINGFKR